MTRLLWLTLATFLPCLLSAQSLPASAPASAPTSAPVTTPTAPAIARCSDGFVSSDEQCDDGNILNGDGCSISCKIEGCGDGSLQGGKGELCDDGNTNNGDGCSSTCQLEQSYRSRQTAFLIGAGVTLLGIPITAVTDSSIPVIVSFGIGPTLGRLYARDYRQAGLYTALRGSMIGVFALGVFLAQENFRSENVGNFVPFDAFPGDGSVLLASTLVVGSVLGYAGLAIYDVAGVRNGPGLQIVQKKPPTLWQALQISPSLLPTQTRTPGLLVQTRF